MAIEIAAQLREESNPRKLRRQGFIPGVVYGNDTHKTVQIAAKDLKNALKRATRSSRFEISVDGKTYDTFLREIQYHPLNDDILHIDFYQPRKTQNVTMEVRIKLVGTPAGLKMGGILSQIRGSVLMRGPMDNIPEIIELDVTHMNVGSVLRVGDIEIEGVLLLLPLDSTIAYVKLPRRLEVTAAAEGEAGEEAAEAAEETAETDAEAAPPEAEGEDGEG